MENTIDNVLSYISKKYNVTIEELKGRRRTKNIAKARINAYVLLRIKHNFTYEEISKVFNRGTSAIIQLVNQHHKTFIDGEIKKSKKSLYILLLEEEASLKYKLEHIKNLINIYKK